MLYSIHGSGLLNIPHMISPSLPPPPSLPSELSSSAQRRDALRLLCLLLPQANRDTLQELLQFLSRVALHSDGIILIDGTEVCVCACVCVQVCVYVCVRTHSCTMGPEEAEEQLYVTRSVTHSSFMLTYVPIAFPTSVLVIFLRLACRNRALAAHCLRRWLKWSSMADPGSAVSV